MLKGNSVILPRSFFFFLHEKFLNAFLLAFSWILKYLLERNSSLDLAEGGEKLAPLFLALETKGWISLDENHGGKTRLFLN